MASLAKTNKYLATAEQRKQVVRISIATSSAIDGIHAPFRQPKAAKKAPAEGSKAVRKGSKPPKT
ncbi:MAG: hypothetical protein MEQ07_07145 [Aquimonas sp.]|nr:hypothetical protein [Aquimonas sp.]